MDFVYGAWALVPPLAAIGLAIFTRQVILSLLFGIYAAWFMIDLHAVHDGNGMYALVPLMAGRETLTALIDVFAEGWQTKTILFTLLMGSMLLIMQRSGGITAFVEWVGQWHWSKTRVGAQMMAWFVGLGVFVESTITCLVVGTVARPLFDKLKISREKLAYICDSTSAPVCILLPINGWGATVLALLAAQAAAGALGGMSPLHVFLVAIPLNLYAILSVLMVLTLILTGKDFGPMAKAEKRAREEGKVLADDAMPTVDTDVIMAPVKEGIKPRLSNMMIPMLAMLFLVPLGIIITGWSGWTDTAGQGLSERVMGLLNEASGSTSVFWGVSFSVLLISLVLWIRRDFNVHELVEMIMKGAGGLISLATIMMLAFAIGAACQEMQAGAWVASVLGDSISGWMIAPLVFLVSGFVAFSTGTSWGTFAIMIPFAVPLAGATEVSIPLAVSAVLGGGVFGDHCSPISDTTVVSSMAASSDHIDHVRTQLPYALLVAAISTVGYAILGGIL